MRLEDIVKFDGPFASACFQAMSSIQGKLKRMRNEDGNIDEQNYVLELAGSIGAELTPTEFLLGGELRKEITSSNEAVRKLIARIKNEPEGYTLPNVTVKPDYAIHYFVKRENLDGTTQKVVIEAKTTNRLAQDSFSWDSYKLGAYVNELSFQTAIYLIINTDRARVETLLDGYKEQGLPEIKVPTGRLLFFIQDSIDSAPKPYVLNCLVENHE